nr:hypothetical protein [Planctomycetota bacterium]
MIRPPHAIILALAFTALASGCSGARSATRGDGIPLRAAGPGMSIALAAGSPLVVGIDCAMPRSVLTAAAVAALGAALQAGTPEEVTTIAGTRWSIIGRAVVALPLGRHVVRAVVLVATGPG